MAAALTDGAEVAASLTDALAGLTFRDLDANAVGETLIDAVAAWADAQGWRVYRRAPSVMMLPPPMQHRPSVVDIACARTDGPPIVVEVDRTDRQRTLDKLVAEAAAGRLAIWLRWGPGGFAPPPPPLQLVTLEVTKAPGRRFSRLREPVLPAPRHSIDPVIATAPSALPFPD